MENKLSILILNKNLEKKLINFLNNNNISLTFFNYGKGTGKNKFLDFINFSDEEKIIAFLSVEKDKEKDYEDFLIDEIKLKEKNTGFMFYLGRNKMSDKMCKLIVTIVTGGYSDIIMDEARKCGVTGGTILDGRGTGEKQAKFLDFNIDSKKEVILNVVDDSICSTVIDNINRVIEENKEISGIVFSLDVCNFNKFI